MSPLQLSWFTFLIFFSSVCAHSQTVLQTGDIVVFAWSSDMELCGLSPMSDEFSFMCFQDIETGTEIDFTDNGWEHTLPGFWGDTEGVIRMTRTGGMIPAGTVLTIQGQFIGGNWVYNVLPDGHWDFDDLNAANGNFNLDPGGDQITFMQGGTWSTPGGNKGDYDGRMIWSASSTSFWTADGTDLTSNIHPQLQLCHFQEMAPGLNTENIKFTGHTQPGTHFDWINRVKGQPEWVGEPDCVSWNAVSPNYVGAVFQIDGIITIMCFNCVGCAGYGDALGYMLPWDGLYNIVYTNGTDTIEAFDVFGYNGFTFNVYEDISYWLVSLEEVGGCTIYSNLGGVVDYTALYADPGEHGELWVCPDGPYVELIYFLEGTPDPGGTWYPAIGFNQYYFPQNGPGVYTYVIEPDPEHTCPADTATVSIFWIEINETVVEVGCHQNGTPYDIEDDRIEITLTVIGQNFGADYYVTSSFGSVTPGYGLTGVPQVFLLDPGTAIGQDLTITIEGIEPLWCKYEYDIEAPGYCSDPCDPDMITDMIGPETICLLDCPDEPEAIAIEFDGGTWPFTLDFQIQAPGYPTWNFSDFNIDELHEITLCAGDVPVPFYDSLSRHLTIPNILAGSGFTFHLVGVRDEYGCTGTILTEDLFIDVHPLPAISTTSLSYCFDDALSVDLTEFDNLISLFYPVTWYNGNPWDGGDEIFNATAVNLTGVDVLYAQVEGDFCKNSIQVPLIIHPVPDLDSVPPIVVCQGENIALQSIAFVDAGSSMATYSFHTALPPDSSNILNPLLYVPADSAIIYVLATAGMCYDTMPLQIFVEDFPDFTLQAQPCDLIAGTYSIFFTSSADSIHTSMGVVVNNPAGQDAVTGIPNNTNVMIEIINATGLCKDTFLIFAPNCNCPQINQPLPTDALEEICEDGTIPVLSVTVDPGLQANWYDVPSGGTPLIQNSLTYQPVVAADAIYYIEALNPASACYSIRTAIALEVHPLAMLQHPDDPVICEGETINLDALAPGVLNGVAGSGAWLALPLNQTTSGVQQPADGDSWQYVYTAAQGGCISRDTLSAVVHPLPLIDLYDIVCDDVLLTYELLLTSDANVVIANAGNLVQIAGTDSFSLEDIAFDTDIQIDLEYLATGCTSIINLPAPDCSCPALLQDDDYEVCSNEGTIDLSIFEGPGVNGAWQMVSVPSGSNPATLSGSDLNVLQSDGGTYTLRFIRSLILANCVDTAFFEMILHESPFVDAGADAMICAPDAIVLTGAGGGDNVMYSWQTTGSGTIPNPGALSTTYAPTLADITTGSVGFTLFATDQSGFCPLASESITMTIDGSAYYILNAGTQTYCDTTDAVVDLDALISYGTTGGEWFFPDTVNAPVTGSSQINPSTIPAGNYTIFYTTQNAVAPCENDTTGVNLIIENCLCPSVAISSPAQGLCSESGTFNLNTLLLTSEVGTWSIVNAPAGTKPAVVTGGQFVTSGSDAGIYRVRFSLSSPVSGCPDFSEVNMEVTGTPILSLETVKCADGLQSWEAVVSASSGSVISSSLGSIVPLGSNRFRIEAIPLNTLIQVTAASANGLCTTTLNIDNADCECTLSITNLPDEVSLCPEESVTLQPQVVDPKGGVTSYWIIGNDSLYQNTLNVTEAGSYEYVVIDDLGCKENHRVDVFYYQEMVAGVSWMDITCPGDRDGSIVLQDIVGGTGPYLASVNNGPLQIVSAFPYFIDGLGAGNYHVELFDVYNCSTDFNVQINASSSETLTLGPDLVILVGDSVMIDPQMSFNAVTFYWAGDVDNLLATDQLTQWIHPETDQVYQLSAIDAKGCLYTDDLKIRVLLNSSIYVPNVFTPNGDGVNDVIGPLPDPSITEITYFEIYSRWGELVYSVKDLIPNQDVISWDGTLGGEMMQAGVFVYRVGAVNKRGKEFELFGDLMLLR